jgi:hypothetical protein
LNDPEGERSAIAEFFFIQRRHAMTSLGSRKPILVKGGFLISDLVA